MKDTLTSFGELELEHSEPIKKKIMSKLE